jgi:hypothetical protein
MAGFVMAGFVPAIHDFRGSGTASREWPGKARPDGHARAPGPRHKQRPIYLGRTRYLAAYARPP